MTSIYSHTLAPPPLIKMNEGIYEPKNLSKKDAELLKSISKNNINNAEFTLGTTTQFLSNLKLYKECLIDTINIQAEMIDLATKYAIEPPKQQYTLPGVISMPPSYDLEGLKTDNIRMEELKELRDKSTQQKELYLRIIQEDFREFLTHFKKLLYFSDTLDQFIASLNEKTNANY